MSKYVHKSDWFCGNQISDYGLQNGYMDYATLAKSFNHVLNNEIVQLFYNPFYFEIINGIEYNAETDEYTEIYQYFIISEHGADILCELTDEIVYYCDELNMYIWAITHFGTSWTHVLTDIPIDLSDSKISA